ncbi:MAG TPA: MFS transporter [Actinomycetota bacterium]
MQERGLAGLRSLGALPGFRRLLSTQILSQTADGLYQIAVASVLVFDVSAARTPGQVTKVLAVTLIPFSVVGPFVGPFIDRFSRRSILVGSNVIRVALTLALVPALGWPEPALLALIVANVSVNRFFHATKSAVLPLVVPETGYLLANTVSSTAGMVFGLLGAVIGGPLTDLVDERAALLAAATLMAAAAVVAGLLALPPGERRGLRGIVAELGNNWRDVRQGLRVLLARRGARYAVAAIWTIRGVLGFVLLASLVILRTRLDAGVTGFSVLLGAAAAGGFVGAIAVPAAARRLGGAGVAPVALLVAGAATLALGPIRAWASVVGAVFIAGLTMTATKVTADTIVQREIPDGFRGRAFAVYDIGYNGVFVVAALVPTLLASLLGPVGIIVLTGALSLLAGAGFAAWRRRLESPPRDGNET